MLVNIVNSFVRKKVYLLTLLTSCSTSTHTPKQIKQKITIKPPDPLANNYRLCIMH